MLRTLIVNSTVKSFFLFFVFLISVPSLAQYREEYGEQELRYLQQSDSIYRSHKVKIRRAYQAADYPAVKKLLTEYVFDVEGRIVQIQYEPYVGGQIRTCYYSYQADGKLVSVKDVLVKDAPNPGLKNLIGKEEYQKQVSAIPARIEYNYVIQYKHDSLSNLTATDASGVRIRTSSFSDNGLTHVYHKLTGSLFQSTTRYLQNRRYKFLPVTILSFFEGVPPTESTFEYVFDNSGRLLERIEYKKNYSPLHVQVAHDENDLLKSAGAEEPEVVFEYEFWK